MPVIMGTLSISGSHSTLRPQNALLLRSGFPDANQAAAAATSFIVKVKGLEDGAEVTVTGTPGTVGTQPTIIMSDIRASAQGTSGV